jgi:hypothetical protein
MDQWSSQTFTVSQHLLSALWDLSCVYNRWTGVTFPQSDSCSFKLEICFAMLCAATWYQNCWSISLVILLWISTWYSSILSLSWQVASQSATQEFPNISWNPKVHYRVHKSLSFVPILTHISTAYTAPFYPPKTHLNIILPYILMST